MARTHAPAMVAAGSHAAGVTQRGSVWAASSGARHAEPAAQTDACPSSLPPGCEPAQRGPEFLHPLRAHTVPRGAQPRAGAGRRFAG